MSCPKISNFFLSFGKYLLQNITLTKISLAVNIFFGNILEILARNTVQSKRNFNRDHNKTATKHQQNSNKTATKQQQNTNKTATKKQQHRGGYAWGWILSLF